MDQIIAMTTSLFVYFAQSDVSCRTGSAKSGAEEPKAQAEEEVDIDLNDPEVAAAATKIQAGFRGHKAREEVKGLKVSISW